ncbi:hypothetical protein BH10ACI1_BH10ACI1_24880 [soil metagenome]
MTPSPAWFPSNLPERANFFANFKTQFTIVAASLGLAGKVGQIDKDNDVIQFIDTVKTQVDAFDDAMRKYRRIITEGAIGANTPDIPAVPALDLPATVNTGIFQRLSELRTQILAADGYTEETGALLGILPSQPDPIAPINVKLGITVHEAANGYVFTVVASNRAESDSWDVYALRKGANSPEKLGTFLGKSADMTFVPTTPGLAERFQCHIQGRKSNQNYGQPSDIVNVTVNP